MDLIDRKEVMEDLSLAFAFHAYAGAVAESIVKAQPAVDAMPVVRCKECRHSKTIKLKGHVKCDLLHDVKPYDWFCSDGERKEVTE